MEWISSIHHKPIKKPTIQLSGRPSFLGRCCFHWAAALRDLFIFTTPFTTSPILNMKDSSEHCFLFIPPFYHTSSHHRFSPSYWRKVFPNSLLPLLVIVTFQQTITGPPPSVSFFTFFQRKACSVST